MPRPRSWSQTAGSARLVIGTTLVTAITDPLHRPIAWVGALLVVTCSALALLISLTLPSLVVGVVCGLVGTFGLVVLVGGAAELVATARADQLWRHLDNDSQAVRATALTTHTRDGGWKLKSVAAWPFHTGAGSDLVDAICREADMNSVTIRLESSTPRITGFYTRHGFTPGRRTLAGGHTMSRPPRPPGHGR